MKIKLMNAGDRVLSVTTKFVAIERASGEVDILPMKKKGKNYWVNPQSVLTLGFDTDEVKTELVDGVTITHF